MPSGRTALLSLAAAAAALAVVSGGSGADPRTPPALPGMPAPFLGTAVTGSGRATAAVDAYGDLVDLRASPVGPALLANPSARQAAGTVPAATGVVPELRTGGRRLPPWRARSVAQRYLAGTNVVRTVARYGRGRLVVTDAARGNRLALVARIAAQPSARAWPSLSVHLEAGPACRQQRRSRVVALYCTVAGAGSGLGRGSGEAIGGPGATPPAGAIAAARATIRGAVRSDRRWLRRARELGEGAPGWARSIYRRSLLVLRALTARDGAVAAGARDGWAYVWPRDAAAAAMALKAAGYPRLARRVAGFLARLDLTAAARFDGGGRPVPGRGAEGDEAGWVAAAPRAGGLPVRRVSAPWRRRSDYREDGPGNYLGNALASVARSATGSERVRTAFATRRGLVRAAGAPGSGLDAAAAWAVRPFPRPLLFERARETMRRLVLAAGPFGITPGRGWPGAEPWSAPTAWTAWSLAALARAEHGGAGRGDRRLALVLLEDLRRAATPAGTLPERVGARGGIPRSTTPLAWSHAFAILALRTLWPPSTSAARLGQRKRHASRSG